MKAFNIINSGSYNSPQYQLKKRSWIIKTYLTLASTDYLRVCKLQSRISARQFSSHRQPVSSMISIALQELKYNGKKSSPLQY
jgi:hypothetical protein